MQTGWQNGYGNQIQNASKLCIASSEFGFSFLARKLLYNGKLHLILEDYGANRQSFVDFIDAYESVNVEGGEVTERDGTSMTIHFSSQEITASELINQLPTRYETKDWMCVSQIQKQLYAGLTKIDY